MRIQPIALALLILAATGCSHASVTRYETANCDARVRSKIARQLPYWLKFSGPNQTVLFIATEHGEEPGNRKSFDLIRAAFRASTFDRVIVESLKSEWGLSPKRYLQEIENGQRKLGEPAFT